MSAAVMFTPPAAELEPAPSTAMLQDQLYRYAEDMHELMEQHGKLQTNFKMVLKSIGRKVPSDDVLPRLLLASAEMYVVTDSTGVIVSANMAASSAFCLGTNDLRGISIEKLFSHKDQQLAAAVVEKFSNGRPPGGIEHRTLEMLENAPSPTSSYFDILIMQMQRHNRRELVWFMKDSKGPIVDTMQMQKMFLADVVSEDGLMITDPFGAISWVNAAFCKISGYTEAEVLGRNPRMMSSGRHESSFFQEFWIELLGSGSWSGEIFNRRKSGQIFLEWESIKMVEDERGNVISYIATISDLSQRGAANSELSQLAYHDPLTGLPNRRLLEERMMKAMADASRDSSVLFTLFIDLDRFKPLNDELGHHVGDFVLQTVASRLKESVRHGDTVARVGGDEFVILLPRSSNGEQAELLADTLLNRLAEPIWVDGKSVEISASVGCSQYPKDGSDMASLIRNADAAMYGAKRFGTSFSHFDTGGVQKASPSIGFEVWGALARNELQLVYQPQVDAITGSCRGCEVLLRWNHPKLGSVDPSKFIPIAEQTGAILEIGNWVLTGACQQLAQWVDKGFTDLTLTVNVSLRQLRDPAFSGHVAHCLAENGVHPNSLEFDLSETDALQYREEDFECIKALRKMGIRIAINDFGVAFTRLSRLNDLSISCLKINPKLVENIPLDEEAQRVSRCLVAMADALEIELVAGGVETNDQLRVLIDQGCKVVQGFLTGRPMNPKELSEFMLKAKSHD